uniref:Leucine-rich repeat-containing protein 58-like n=1 Tax=Hirondellea gigas TaxID=1518452 RepID=A0A2P2HZZ1_9CRUS
MYYCNESSDSDTAQDSKSLDFSYLMLDSHSLSNHLRNSIREQQSVKRVKSSRRDHVSTDEPSTSNYNNATGSAQFPSTSSSLANETENTLKDNFSWNKGIKFENTSDSLTYGAVDQCIGDSNSEQLRILSLNSTSAHSSKISEDGVTYTVIRKDNITEKLDLNHNQIINLPFEIIQYHKLRFVNLSNNNISHVNDYILQLPELQTLILKNNAICNDGLPKELSVLSKLREVNLSSNLLTAVPPSLCQVSSLRYLYLGNNQIPELTPDIKGLQSLQILNMGGNNLTSVPDDVGELSKLEALILCNNKLQKLPRAISRLSNLRSLLLHNNKLCTLPVEIVKLKGISELSLRDNPLVSRFVNSCAKDLMLNPPSLKELAARTVRQNRIQYTAQDLPPVLHRYLSSGHKCVNPKCKGVYFASCVEHIKFVDFCGMYRVPLMHYLCSSRCTEQTPSFYGSDQSDDSDEGDDAAAAHRVQDSNMRKVLLG